MPIIKPSLPPKSGFVEVEVNGERVYKNISSGEILNPYTEKTITPITHEEINSMVVARIREKYDVNEEFKMINLGIADSNSEEYIAYRSYVQECVDWGNSLEKDGD